MDPTFDDLIPAPPSGAPQVGGVSFEDLIANQGAPWPPSSDTLGAGADGGLNPQDRAFIQSLGFTNGTGGSTETAALPAFSTPDGPVAAGGPTTPGYIGAPRAAAAANLAGAPFAIGGLQGDPFAPLVDSAVAAGMAYPGGGFRNPIAEAFGAHTLEASLEPEFERLASSPASGLNFTPVPGSELADALSRYQSLFRLQSPLRRTANDSNYNQTSKQDAAASTICEAPGYPESGKTSWRNENDQIIRRAVNAYNTEHNLSPGDGGYMTPELMKAWEMEESGGQYTRRAFESDPWQVNNAGDSTKLKASVTGLSSGQIMTPELSARAALEWYWFRGHPRDASGTPTEWIGDERALERYNANKSIDDDGKLHYSNYAAHILSMTEKMRGGGR